jgi:prepilin-type N-terminal cleavage/methylation domain-containing protein
MCKLCRTNTCGFTLIELIISLTVVSLVAVMIYAALNVGARAADHGAVRSLENQRARAAIALITRQLKSAYPLTLQGEEGAFVYFFGEPRELSFVSGAGRPEVGGLEKITYFIREHDGRRSLWVRTSAPTLPADLLNNREGALRQESEVLPDVETVSWEYLSRSQQQVNVQKQPREEWTDRWDGAKERVLPAAVRFSWRARVGELPYEWRMEVPLYVLNPPPDLVGAAQGGAAGARNRRFREGRGR